MATTGTDDETTRVAHLYRRAGFGARPDELEAAVGRGYEATVDRLLDLGGPDPVADAVPGPTFSDPADDRSDPAARRDAARRNRDESARMMQWWLNRMVASTNPLREKLTLFWHDHFATSLQKVKLPQLMYDQNQLFRSMGAGRFEPFVQAVAKDPAMLLWLDSNTNVAKHPNENFSRELLELFTLGIGNYTERDVAEGARAFTGWRLARATRAFTFERRLHDNGPKTVLGQTGAFGGEDVIRVVTSHPATARFVAAKAWSHFAHPVATDDPVVDDLVASLGSGLDVSRMLRALFLHPRFVSDDARDGLVKQPIEWLAGALRALGLNADDPALLRQLNQLGQLPFMPPSVGGWPQNTYWLTTASSLGRLRLAEGLIAKADLSAVAAATPSERPPAAAHQLSVDGWGSATTEALGHVRDDPKALMALALVSPEYVLA